MVEGRGVASALVFRAFLPPHPALSLGERENRPPLRGESNAQGRAGVSALNRGAHGATGSDARLNKDAGCPFPLPPGEGQGEGERDGGEGECFADLGGLIVILSSILPIHQYVAKT